ncbi:hypothetical protein [Pedobacter metabolipauper]|uniref:GLPGLI family protein n=1 Tax=Pedobacter metabolipauper TaxID=425513 RepID=A0A4R6STZ9_9SPHI|nr:hypothetical protein [Pedobacter metabolipauper]TDQ08413.1 hypothetical protein ATK78_2926 [Pedobacter metabolipauper]
MRKLTITCILSLSFVVVFGQEMKVEQQKVVSDFIYYIKNQKKEILADRVSYPLKREYPIPEIKNKQEFLKRYTEVFDNELIKMIVNSKPAVDWSAVGWRGIMLLRGDVWLDYDGRLIGVNHQSNAERKKREKLIALDKSYVHESIKEFERPIVVLETTKYIIRIDDMGSNSFRYAAWNLSGKMSDKPNLILKNGKLTMEGSGGNHKYEFKSGTYTYTCPIFVTGGKNTPPALLVIYKGGKEILAQKAQIRK